jgi:hypothetical protein
VSQLLKGIEQNERTVVGSEMIYDPKFGGVQPKDSVMVETVEMSVFDPTKGF